MIVYGDADGRERPADVFADVVRLARAAAAVPAGIDRHGALVAALARAGELLQAVADRDPPENRPDGLPPPAVEALQRLLDGFARVVLASRHGDLAAGDPPDPAGAATTIASLPDETLRIRRPEGYAFYALYPETVAAAARRLPAGRWRVVGIRSIGTSLAPVAAAALEAEAWTTVRPVGHPFARRIEATAAFTRRIAEGADRVAVVDEGPGLSGSSFGAVADWLEAAGVPRGRIAFLPSHDGDLGPHASAAHRERWRGALRPVASADAQVFGPAAPGGGLAGWFDDLAGPGATIEDVGGGAWRAHRIPAGEPWPAAFRMQERRKFLVRGPGGTLLATFAGIGAVGERKHAMQRDLAESGFAVAPLALRHGILATPWLGDARPGPMPFGEALVAHLAAYLAHRTTRFPADRPGASLEDLAAMAAHNLTAAGLKGEAMVAPYRPALPALQVRVRPIAIDGRMHAHEWLTTADGRVLKTDAVDHHAAHDLIGCQDVAWDVAGAAVEFGLDPAAREDLAARVGRAIGAVPDATLLAFLTLAYAAFQLGRSTMAAEADGDPAEIARHRADADRYATAAAAG